MESTTPSKGSIFCNKVKTLLMRAWRERWLDNHWGVMLKKMLIDVPGESKELAGDYIIQCRVACSFSSVSLQNTLTFLLQNSYTASLNENVCFIQNEANSYVRIHTRYYV